MSTWVEAIHLSLQALLAQVNRAILTASCQETRASNAPRRPPVRHHPSLRTATQPVTAAALAERLEVTVRTIYRDIAALQGSRVPIEGAPGLGYVLRRGFDLPPLMFTSEEADAIAIGVRLLRRLRDAKLQQAAERVLAKLAVVVPESLQPHLVAAPIYVSDGDAPSVTGVDPAALRDAIHDARKIAIAYTDEQGRHTHRTVRPIAMAYYVDITLLGAWCELRNDFR